MIHLLDTSAVLALLFDEPGSDRIESLIAATADHLGATLMHRDPHFAVLPVGRPVQEASPNKN